MIREFIGCMRDQKFNLKDMYSHLYRMKFKFAVCPVCGSYSFNEYFICRKCGWEYDSDLREDGYSYANGFFIEKYKKEYNCNEVK